tara:strand:- start:1934 stop:2101 length:168 start_codon:yes stop_codon:yes gene_type:complete
MSTYNEVFFTLTEEVQANKEITSEEAIKMFREQCLMSKTEAEAHVYSLDLTSGGE